MDAINANMVQQLQGSLMMNEEGDGASWVSDPVSVPQLSGHDSDHENSFSALHDMLTSETENTLTEITERRNSALRPYIPVACTTSNKWVPISPVVSIPPCKPMYTVPLIYTQDYVGLQHKMQGQSWSEPHMPRFQSNSSDDDQNSVAASAISDPLDKRPFVLCKIENGRYVKATLSEAEQLATALEESLNQYRTTKKQRVSYDEHIEAQKLSFTTPQQYNDLDGFHKMQYKKGGPCDQCGVTETPQWRRGPPEKPTLCNACGTRFRRTGRLELAVSRGIKRRANQCQDYRVASEQCQSFVRKLSQNQEIEVIA